MKKETTLVDVISFKSYVKIPRGSKIIGLSHSDNPENLQLEYFKFNSEDVDVYAVYSVVEYSSIPEDLVGSKFYGTFKTALGNTHIFLRIDKVEKT